MARFDSRNHIRHRASRLGACALLMLAGACAVDVPTGARVFEPTASLAKGGSAAPAVSSVVPDSAKQDTTIDVNVFGTGFATGARAAWSLNGDTTKVHVKSTKVVSSTQLTVRIEVPASAPLAQYDVLVANTDGKKGIGAELFTVTLGNATSTWLFPIADAGLSMRSDHQFSDGTYSSYTPGVCSFTSTLFTTGSGDNVIGFTYPPKRGGCGRTWTLRYPDGYTETLAYHGSLQILESPTYSIPIGTTVLRHMRFAADQHTSHNPVPGRCDLGLVFGPNGANPALGSDSVQVTRVDASTWHVQSRAAPNDHAFCIDNGQLYEMQVDFIIVASQPLP
jgi:hypothetical protein